MTIDVQSALIGAFVTVAIMAGMLLRQRGRRTDVLFALLSINLVLWYLAAFLRGVYGPDPWLRIEVAISALIPAAVLTLFVDLLRGATPAARGLRTWSYPLSTLVAVTALSPLGDLEPVQIVAGTYVALMILLTSRVMLRTTHIATGTVEYARLRYLAIGAVVATTLGIAGRLPLLGEGAPAVGHLAVMIYVFFLSQAILRDRLLDLHEFLGRMVVLGVLGLLFAAISSLLIVGLGNNPSLRLFNTVVSVIILLTLYEPLKDRMEAKAIELFSERHGLAQLLDQLRRRMLRVLDPENMAKLILDTLYDARRATHAAVYLLEPLGRGFALAAYRGPEPAHRVDERELPALWHAIQRHRAPLLTEHLSRAQEASAEKSTNRDLIEAMRQVSADVLLPFVASDRVLGFLALRDDRVAEPYSTDELALLMNIAEASVIVIENSQLALRLRERDRLAAIGEMAAGLAHEIRNPLGAIKGAAEYLDPGGYERREDAELLQVIIDEADRLNSVVSQFLDYARPFRAQFSATDLNDVVRRTAKLVEAQQKDRPGPIELDLDETLPLVDADAEQMKQVILNLLLNGLEASEGRGAPVSIATRAFAERDRVELRVRDRGGGIPREIQDHIFIPFFTTKAKGTGLGLAVCHRIVTNHGGFIHVQSQVDQGTEFTVRLPIRRKKDAGSITGSYTLPARTDALPTVSAPSGPPPMLPAVPVAPPERKHPSGEQPVRGGPRSVPPPHRSSVPPPASAPEPRPAADPSEAPTQRPVPPGTGGTTR